MKKGKWVSDNPIKIWLSKTLLNWPNNEQHILYLSVMSVLVGHRNGPSAL